MERHLVAFDVDAIKEYVFAAVRPLDITGASRVVESFTQEAARLPGAVYAGGGNGILIRESGDEARQLCEQLEAGFAELTGDAGSCTAVTVPQGDDFRSARQRLWRELERRKATRALDEQSHVLVPGGVRCCQACGREPGNIPLEGREDDPNEEQYIGRQCALRRKAGWADRAGAGPDEPAPVRRDLSELFTDPGDAGSEPEQPGGRGQALAAVYLDADRAGERLRALGGMREVKAFAESVRSVTRAALYGAIRELRLEGRFIAPVVGGDDVLVFIDATQAAKMVSELWQRLRPLERWDLRFSVAVAVAPPRAPLRLLLRQVEVDLRVAKQAAGDGAAGSSSRSRSEPAVVVVSLLGGRLHDSRSPLFGGPVPQSLWNGSPSVLELVKALAEVAPSQRAGMAEDLAQPSQELAALDLEYRAVAGRRTSAPSRNGSGDGREVQRALTAGQQLTSALRATCPQVSLTKVLLGGLAATEWWGRR